MTAPYDVIVVGGGPAGASFVLQLAARAPELARRTLVLEKARHPREKYCGGAISAFGLRELSAIGYELDVPYVPIDGFRVRYGEHASEHARPGLGVVIRRNELDHSLWRAASRTGATLLDGEEVVAAERSGALWHVRTATGRVEQARVLIGADGTGSRVRKLVGFDEASKRARLYVLETPPCASESSTNRTLEFDLGVVADGIEGYYWDFPILLDGKPAVSRGIFHLNTQPKRELKQVLARFLERRGLDPSTVTYKPFSERPYSHRAPLRAHGLLLVGEAAGIDAVTGEGIAHAFVYARVAASVVVEGFARGELHFEDYGARVRATQMAQHLRQSSALAPYVYGPRAADWADFLASRENVVAACARWYEGEALGFGTLLPVALQWLRHQARA